MKDRVRRVVPLSERKIGLLLASAAVGTPPNFRFPHLKRNGETVAVNAETQNEAIGQAVVMLYRNEATWVA